MTTTPYSDIYEIFLGKIEDYGVKKIIQMDYDLAEDMLFGFLKSAIPKFTYSINDLYDRDDILLSFNYELTHMEKEILATLMLAEYMSPKIFRDEYMEYRLGSSDYKTYSPVNQLRELKDLKKTIQSEANTLMIEYYYRDGVK